MSHRKIAVVILAAGLGTRMKSTLPKVLHPLAGRPMIRHLLETVDGLDPDQVVVVVGEAYGQLSEAVAPYPVVTQAEQRGTGHAVRMARQQLSGFDGDVFVLFGGDPLITLETLEAMLHVRASEDNPAVVVLGFQAADPGAYGRLITSEDGTLEAIVEARDASPEQLEITLCNSGVMLIDGAHIWQLLDRVGCDNAKNEYYLTDIVGLARDQGLDCRFVEGDEEELLGVDNRVDLALAELIMQDRLRTRAMENGATLSDPGSVFFSFDTVLGEDVSVGPNVVFGPGVTVEDGATIKAFSHLEGAHVAVGATVGPYARLRPGAQIGAGAKIGNFVEIKNTVVHPGAKISHLSYIGDAEVGEDANIGAGTITCNYDGFFKSKTVIGKGAFIGSNTALVAPVTIGEGAVIGAGSTISRDVEADSLALTRADHRAIVGWAKSNRDNKSALKAKQGNNKKR